MKKNNKKVIVAMSGGVDSSVVATMLKKEGYDVTGVFMNFWKDISARNDSENRCCYLDAIQSARNVAQILNIPFYVLNVQDEFKKKVVNYFLSEIKKGNTPNPCIECNKEIKFKILLEKMISLKADYVATGHYAQISKKSGYRLFKAKDSNKDQSYFLYKLNQERLSKILFPLGKYTKSEVKKIAKKFKLPVYDKKESQDICFIPAGEYENFLRKMLKFRKGRIVDSEGNVLGNHEGLPFYTIGQRKGIKIGGNGPYYVIKKDFKKDELVVSNKKEDLIIFGSKIKLKDINWIGRVPNFPAKISLRTRYRNPLVCAIIDKNGRVVFNKLQKAITPGQSAVFYSKSGEVLGGGTII